MKSSAAAGSIFLIALITALVTACNPKPSAPPQPDTAAIRIALDAQLAKFLPAMQAKDVAAAAELFADEATWILPNASTFTGRAQIESGIRTFMESYESFTPGTMAIEKLVVISDTEALTFSRGTYTIKMKGNNPVNHTNPFADYWKKGAHGVWRIEYEVNAEGVLP